jgi:hypothetical protein
MNTIAQAIAQAKTEIAEDVAAGHIPATVETFADLHEYVDANMYGAEIERVEGDVESMIDAVNAVQGALDAWIKGGGLIKGNGLGYDDGERRLAQVAALAHRTESALDSGQQAFWAVMVEHFPEVEAGDFGPEESVALDEALKDALRLWLYWNLPTPEQA